MNSSHISNIAFSALIVLSDFVILALAVNGIACLTDYNIVVGVALLALTIVAVVVFARVLAYIDIKMFGENDFDIDEE